MCGNGQPKHCLCTMLVEMHGVIESELYCASDAEQKIPIIVSEAVDIQALAQIAEWSVVRLISEMAMQHEPFFWPHSLSIHFDFLCASSSNDAFQNFNATAAAVTIGGSIVYLRPSWRRRRRKGLRSVLVPTAKWLSRLFLWSPSTISVLGFNGARKPSKIRWR